MKNSLIKSFPTPYSNTELGRVNEASSVAAVFGSGNVTVTYESD